MKNTKIIPIINNKGGVAKTITAVSTASILAEIGYKTLLIDLDQQANATSAVGVQTSTSDLTVYDIFFNRKTVDDVAVKTEYDNLYLVPSSNDFVSAISRLTAERIPDKDNILNRAIVNAETDYDYIIIDCPPALDLIITNAIMPATNIVIVTSPRKFSTDGIKGILAFINDYKPYMQNFNGMGVLITMYEKRRNIIDGVVRTIKSQQHLNVYNTMISKSTVIEQSAYMGVPINHFDSISRGAKQYSDFVNEMTEE